MFLFVLDTFLEILCQLLLPLDKLSFSTISLTHGVHIWDKEAKGDPRKGANKTSRHWDQEGGHCSLAAFRRQSVISWVNLWWRAGVEDQ